MIELARAEGLDFVAITDHNTVKALPQAGEDPGFLILPGIEVTVDEGDFNVFGLRGWHDWMEPICTGPIRVSLGGRYRTTTELMRRTAAEGLLNSINHPLLPPWEWRDAETDLRYVHCLEVWNDPYWPDNGWANPKAVALWTAWLNAGYRITAVGGSDYHYPPRPEAGDPGERLGLPATYVCVEERSVAGLLEGLRRRRVFISVGPKVEFRAEAGDRSWGIGDDLGEHSGEVRLITLVHLEGDGQALARIVENGEVVAESHIRDGEWKWVHRVSVGPGHARWYRLDVVDLDGRLLALTNPIFVGPRSAPQLLRYGDFVKV